MEIQQLRALEAIAKEGSFLAAATHLNASQSSLSHAIATLEQDLGARLLDRGRHGAKPTDAGLRILPYVRQVLSSLDAIRAETDTSAGLVSGRVRVGSIPSGAVAFLPKVIAHLERTHPNVEVILLEEPSQSAQTIEDWLRSQMIDVALVELPTASTNTAVLMRDELYAILPSSSPLAHRRQLTIRDLAPEPLIMSRYTSEPLLRAAYARHNLTPRIRFEVQDRGTLISMVREGLGFSIVPRLAFATALPGVTLVPVTPRIRRELGLAIRDKEHASPALRAFLHSAEQIIRKKRR
jgi:DNA-binding transcriptional LysR family regulator